jgi:CBS domain-containing protein
MKVRDIMTDQVRVCGPQMNLAIATEIMWNNDCGVMPVVEDGKLTGIITDRDICIALGTRNCAARDLTVRDVETERVETCRTEDDVHTAMDTMRRAKVRRLPVVDEKGAVRGMLSLNDIVLRAERKRSAVSCEDVVNTIKAINEHRVHKQMAVAS